MALTGMHAPPPPPAPPRSRSELPGRGAGACLHATEIGSKGAGPKSLLRTWYRYGDAIAIGIAGIRIH